MIKHRKLIICILLSYALFIVGIFNVKAQTTTLFFGSDYYFTNGTNTLTTQYSLQTLQYTKYHRFNASGFSPNGGVLGLSIYNSGINIINVGEYDYALIQVYSGGTFNTMYNNLYIENICGSSTYGYALNSQLTNNIFNTEDVSHSVYATTFYIDLKTIPVCNTATASLWRFSATYSDTYLSSTSVSGSTWIYISDKVYLGKEGDSTSQTIANNTQNINNSINNVNDSINDSSIDTNNTTSSTTSWGNKNATNGTITNLLTLPISLLQAIVNGIQSSCSSFSLGSLFGTNITLPCINVGNLIGSGLWSTIDILFSGFMILAIAKKLIKIFNDFTNLKTNQVDELYGGDK